MDGQPPPYQASASNPAARDFIIQTTLTMQDGVYVTQAPVPRRYPDYLGYSILTMLFCCFPLGFVAFLHSLSTREANSSGDSGRAEQDSLKARRFIRFSVGFGIATYVVGIILLIVGTTSAAKKN